MSRAAPILRKFHILLFFAFSNTFVQLILDTQRSFPYCLLQTKFLFFILKKGGGEFMGVGINSALLLVIAIELALIYVRLGQK